MLRGIARAGGTATTFTASGTYTKSASARYIGVYLVGGGGGGGGAGSTAGGVGGDGAPGYCVIVEI
ncbi:MAG: hypothetical protein IT185_09175 [Acidobacteria bacterium]|nr:hypothetical protein [Acidobacteriota bacterium]